MWLPNNSSDFVILYYSPCVHCNHDSDSTLTSIILASFDTVSYDFDYINEKASMGAFRQRIPLCARSS